MPAQLLERGDLLDQLRRELAGARRGQGRLVFITGEAGIGKTALLQAFRAQAEGAAAVLWGNCDSVVPARPLAPVADIGVQVGGGLRRALDSADRERTFEAFLALLGARPGRATVVVIEDLHWADDSTLDLLRVIGRRIWRLPAMLIGSYRDDELAAEHPLNLAMGELPSTVTARLEVPPLSLDAVSSLAAGTGIDAVALRAATAGNPFFVTEVIANPTKGVPVTVRGAVLARAVRLSPAARQLMRVAAVLGPRFDRRLLEAVQPDCADALQECVQGGMVKLEGDSLAFRHELAQQAILQALNDAVRLRLHAQVLAVLRSRPSADPGELAHHAVAAGDGPAVLEFAPRAARHAAALGSHRQAAEHYATALTYSSLLEDREHAELLELYARECQLTDQVAAAVASQQAALEIWRLLGDRLREGDCLRAFAWTLWVDGQGEQALATAQAAVSLLETLPEPGIELARAYAALAQRLDIARMGEDGLQMARRGLELAERLGAEPVAVHALTTIGVHLLYTGKPDGLSTLTEAARRAEAAGLFEDATRALINVIQRARDARDWVTVEHYAQQVLPLIERHDLDLHRRILLVDLAEVDFERGRWQDADRRLNEVLEQPGTAGLVRARGYTVLGRMMARRGDEQAWSVLDTARRLTGGAEAGSERVAYLHLARTEAAWLAGDLRTARSEATELMQSLAAWDPTDNSTDWERGEFGFWAWKAGLTKVVPPDSAKPYLLHARGRCREAATIWGSIGSPYQQGLALADSSDDADLRTALEIFLGLGAKPMTRRVVKLLEEHGARAIPRGPRATTRANPAGLTAREVEILGLISRGLGNSEIAHRLVLSPKTVDHHVSAVLRKLAVPNRAAAAQVAARLGLQDGDDSQPD
jgi:DNA-binding CsgD family transcriptional regulator/tetratricopeptide (TPR) repeat protein